LQCYRHSDCSARVGSTPAARRAGTTLATSATLARLGCDVAQGYAIAHPMPVDDFLSWLAASDSGLVDEALIPHLSHGSAPH